MKKMFYMLSFLILLVGCGDGGTETGDVQIEKHEGLIAQFTENTRGNDTFLLISEIERSDLQDKSSEELVELASERDSAYYYLGNINPDSELEVGMKVNVSWGGAQADSLPPQRDAIEIEVVENE